MTSKTIIFITLKCLIGISCIGQTQGDLNLLKAKFQVEKVPKLISYKEAENTRNEVQVVFAGLFLFYKNFISSQDSQKCVFHPSCSEFGMLAVKKFGIFKGMALTFDRMTRCNALSPNKYQFDASRNVLLDPVSNE